MKDKAKIKAQADRLEKVILDLKMTTRDIANIAGVNENTLYKISSLNSEMSERTASRICYQFEKQKGIYLNREWLLRGEGEMYTHPSPVPYDLDTDETPTLVAAEDPAPFGIDYKARYYALLEKYTELLESRMA